MASFIAETLASCGVGDGDRCSPDLDKLTSQSDELKLELMTFLQSKYVDFDAWLDKTIVLHERYEQLNASMSSMFTYTQNEKKAKLNATSEHAGASGKLEQVAETLSILELLMAVRQLHQSVNDELSCHNFCQTSLELEKMRAALERLDEGTTSLDITKSLKVEHTLLTESLKHAMTEEWNKLVTVRRPRCGVEGSQDDCEVISFTIQTAKGKEHLSRLCQALHSERMLKMRLKSLSEAINEAFDWIVNHPKTTVTEESTDTEVTLHVKKCTKNTSPSWPSTVFKLLYNLMRPLAHRLLASYTTYDGKRLLMSDLSEACGSVPIDMVINGCLSPSLPTNQSDLAKYADVVTDTEKLEIFFQKIGFVSPECKLMTSYLGNLDVLFANKKCQHILSQARRLMKADLYNTVRLEPGDDCANWASFVARPESQMQSAESSSNIQGQMAKLSENTLKFPSCAISTTAVDLMKLAHSMLEEACSSANAACSSQIVYAIRSMFELYTSIVSVYHKQSIETLPQVTALYYNNAMFLSHQLILLGNQYKARLSKVMNDDSSLTFVDLVPLIRALGTETFLDQMHNQKVNLQDCLQAAEGFKSMEVEERFQHAHQSIKQCIHQLNHLRKVWVDVLPHSNYCKSIGHLLSCVIREIISGVQSLEDMSADDTTKLHHLIKQVEDAAPGLFPGDKSSALGYLHKNTPGWTKLHELGIVLTATLHDVVDRWAEGKGPLTVEFSPEQVKSLIRALFQNTERRAAALAKIH